MEAFQYKMVNSSSLSSRDYTNNVRRKKIWQQKKKLKIQHLHRMQ